MTTSSVSRTKATLLYHALVTALMLSASGAAGVKAADADAASADNVRGADETIVVTGTQFKAELAPAKASLDITQPQTIINRPYIEDFVSPQADYVTILAIAPGLTGTDPNGPGLSDGGPKNTLRGIGDGNYNQSYDGIPFGDTNGPTHHSITYFPGSTIGSALVDRGPGNAGTLGAATYGGTIKLFSEPLTDDFHFKGALGYGSFNTNYENLNIQSGAFGTDATRVLLNVENKYSSGALSFQKLQDINALLKVEHDFGQNWKVTLFSNYSNLAEYLNDNNGATPAQVAAYGKNRALQENNGLLPDNVLYSRTRKQTDMDYIHIQGDISNALKVDNTTYTYAYVNHTFSSRNIQQTAADILAGTAEGLGGKFTPVVNGVKQAATDIPGYSKLNQYRVWGNILRLAEDYNLGSVTGQVRAGVWWEGQRTVRARYDFDMTLCNKLGLYPQNYINVAGQSNNLAACADSSLAAMGKAVLTPNGYAEFDEHSAWFQYQPFMELEIHPVENLTVTPGVKYINWLHKTSAMVEPKLLKPNQQSFTTTKTLPFAEVNYKITPSWSVYFQYAQGVYVPDVSSFEQKTPVFQFPAAETTTNYQIGTVYYADNFNVDADLYYIPVHNNLSSVTCQSLGGPTGETCFVNTGNATYKGIEAEGTYAFRGPLEGFMMFASGSIMSAKSKGVWLANAASWTGAVGLLYKHEEWKFAIIDKTVGPQYEDNIQNPNYKLSSYSTVSLTAGYTLGHYELGINVDNLLNSRKVVNITENDAVYQTNRLNSLDQYFFQAPFSIMGTIKVRY